ncbi:hypothetical protein [Bacillus paranthracis]|uniref:hypothetical protein n=1 Tax=Bacillus paranthracis TaxID=2026186 RepID=UPI0035570004
MRESEIAVEKVTGEISMIDPITTVAIVSGGGVGIDLSRLRQSVESEEWIKYNPLEGEELWKTINDVMASPYRKIGAHFDSLASLESMYQREKVSPKEQKRRYREGVKNLHGRRKFYE